MYFTRWLICTNAYDLTRTNSYEFCTIRMNLYEGPTPDIHWLRYIYFKIWNLRVQKKATYWENRLLSYPNEVLSNAYNQSKMKFWFIYDRKCKKYIHGTWYLLNIPIIFGHKRKIEKFDPCIATNIPVLLMTIPVNIWVPKSGRPRIQREGGGWGDGGVQISTYIISSY